ncbi:hypothetical protein [Halalkalicoccus salilacus]|uniref:hypothetical protein n=1 Tax=Halalkalicoccus TaxID=332246 RepID=UPI002F968245
MREGKSRNTKRRKILKGVALSIAAGLVGCTDSNRDRDGDRNNESNANTDDDDATTQRLRPSREHPRYWEYGGESRLLLGATDTDSLFQWGKNPDKLRAHLDELENAGGDYVRNTMNSRREDEGDVHPFEQRENGQYDLNEWNEEFWDRFKLLLSETAQRDIIVQIELWDGHNYQSRTDDAEGFAEWDRHPMNPKNNVNYTAEETTLPKKWTRGYQNETHPVLLTIPSENDDPTALAVQERFIAEVLDHAFEYDHVLYVIQNESWAPQAWSNYWAEFVRENAAERDEEVYLGDMRRYSPDVSPVLEHGFDFAELSQSGELVGQTHFDEIASGLQKLREQPVPANSVKQYGSNEVEWTDGAEEGIARLWRSVFAGQAAVRNHRPPYGIGLNARAKNQIRSLRLVADLVDVMESQPHQHVRQLLSHRGPDECYLMADPGRIYAVYFPSGGQVRLDISAMEGPGYVRWLETDTVEWDGDWTEAQHVDDGTVELNAYGYHWVVNSPENHWVAESPKRHWVAIVAN